MSGAITVYTNRDRIDELLKRVQVLGRKLDSISVRLNILQEQFREYLGIVNDMEEDE